MQVRFVTSTTKQLKLMLLQSKFAASCSNTFYTLMFLSFFILIHGISQIGQNILKLKSCPEIAVAQNKRTI